MAKRKAGNTSREEPGYEAAYARSLIEASLDPLVTISPEGKITDVNEATIKVTGISREGLVGTDFLELLCRARKSPGRLSSGLRKRFCHRLPADDPPCFREIDARPVQRLGV